MYPVLIIDDEPPIRWMLGLYLRGQGYEVLEAADGLTGVDLFEEHQPPIVLTDVRMPKLDGLEVVRRIRSAAPDVAIIVFTGHGGEETAIEALRAGATNYLKKPIEINELGEILNRQVETIRSRLSLKMDPGFLSLDERVLVVPNDLVRVPAIIAYLTATAHLFFSRAEVNYIKLGLDEMIRNAIEHGNFGITYEEKTRSLELGRWEELLAERANDPVLRERRVRIRCRQTASLFECTIEDDGAGFRWQDLPDPQNPENLLASHGRGILLTSFYYDEVRYNDRGNAVTLVKKVSANVPVDLADQISPSRQATA